MIARLCLALVLTSVIPICTSAQLIASKEIYVDHGDNSDVNNPPCKGAEENALIAILDGLMHGRVQIPAVNKFVGAIVEVSSPALADGIAQTGGTIGQLFKPNRYANCGDLLSKLPPGTTNVTFRVYAAGQECTQRDGIYMPQGRDNFAYPLK